jgi:tetratricopeptide (TPR) repeat protein
MKCLTDSVVRPLVAVMLCVSALTPAANAATYPHVMAPGEELTETDQLALAQQAVARGDNAEALSRYVRVLASRPRDLAALIGAGNAAVELGDFSAGLAFFGRAEEVDARNGRVKAGLASALAQTEQPGAALKLFDEAVTLGVPEAEIAGDRGLAWDLRGNPRRAQRDYALALAARPDHEVSMRLALSQAISGERELALRTLAPWLAKTDQGAWRTRAFVLALTGDTAGASQAAAAVLPAAQARAMTPFFTRLAALNPAQKAMAANFGYLPGDKPAAARRAPPATSSVALATALSPVSPAPRSAPPPPPPTFAPPAVRVQAPAYAAAPVPPVTARPAPIIGSGSTASQTPRPTVVAGLSPTTVREPAPSPLPAPAAVKPAVAAPAETWRAPAQVALAAPPPQKPVQAAAPAIVPAPVAFSRPLLATPAATGTPPIVSATAPSPAFAPAPAPKAIVPTTVTSAAASPPATPAAPPVVFAAATPPKPAQAATPSAISASAALGLSLVAPAETGTEVAARPAIAVTTPPAQPAVTIAPPKWDLAALRAQTASDAQAEAVSDDGGASSAALGRVAAAQSGAHTKASAPPKPVSVAAIDRPAESVARTARPVLIERPTRRAAPAAPIPEELALAYAELPRGAARSADAPAGKRPSKASSDEDTAKTDKPAANDEAVGKSRKAKRGEPGTATNEDEKSPADSAKPAKGKVKVASSDTGTSTRSSGKRASSDEESSAGNESPAEKKKAGTHESANSAGKSKSHAERYWVQVAGGANKDDLDKAWSKLQAGSGGKVLKGHKPSTTSLRYTNRLLVGPFADNGAAQAFVNKLAGAGTSSFTFKSAAGQKVDKLPSR